MKINEKFLHELNVLEALLNSGVYLIRALDIMDSVYWRDIQTELQHGKTFSRSIKESEKLPLSSDEKDILYQFIHAGELGGVLEITLRRYISLFSKEVIDENVIFLKFLGTLISCGVPILTAIEHIPTFSLGFITIKSDIYQSVKEGNSISEIVLKTDLFPKYVGPMLDVGEQTGAFPEACLAACDVIERLG